MYKRQGVIVGVGVGGNGVGGNGVGVAVGVGGAGVDVGSALTQAATKPITRMKTGASKITLADLNNSLNSFTCTILLC